MLREASALIRSGQAAKAASLVRDIGMIDPDCHDAEVLRLQIAGARQDPLELLETTERLLATQPNNAQLRFNRIYALYFLGRLEEAAQEIDVALQSSSPAEQHNLNALRFKSMQRHGSGEALQPILDDLIAVEGRTPRIVDFEIDLHRRNNRLDDAIQMARELLDRNNLSEQERARSSLTLARLLDQSNQFDEAFHLAMSINESHPVQFDAAHHMTETESIIRQFSADRLNSGSRSTCTDSRPVFIVGMPRSGTSLLEQIIASHPQGSGLGERQEPFILAEDLCVEMDMPLQAALEQANEEILNQYAARYLQSIDSMRIEGTRVVNKALGLDRVVGFLTLMLPNAKFLWIHRNPADNLLSIYLHLIAKPWAWRLEDLITARKAHDQLRSHWVHADPAHHLDVRYEDLASDQANQTNRILQFLDLPKDDRTLEFHLSARAVMTPSADQVRTPMNQKAIHRWKNYAQHLKPVLDAFDDGSEQFS